MDAVRPYTIIVVVDGKIGALGAMTFRSEADIRRDLELVDFQGNSYRPIAEDDIPSEVQGLLGFMKAGIAGVLGPMGKNMHLFLFPAEGKDSRRIADAKAKGAFTVKLGKQHCRWKLPLGALLPPRQCPKCNEKGSGAWDFCPWCGVKLVKAEH